MRGSSSAGAAGASLVRALLDLLALAVSRSAASEPPPSPFRGRAACSAAGCPLSAALSACSAEGTATSLRGSRVVRALRLDDEGVWLRGIGVPCYALVCHMARAGWAGGTDVAALRPYRPVAHRGGPAPGHAPTDVPQPAAAGGVDPHDPAPARRRRHRGGGVAGPAL